MIKLLIVDPLDSQLLGVDGDVVWSTRHCFLRQFESIDGVEVELANGRDPEICAKAQAVDGVVLGGSEGSAWEDTNFNDHLLDLIAICKNGEIPLLGICYGAQLLGRALGGMVGRNPEGIELGAPPIRITKKGKEHFLFKGITEGCVWSVETHADAVLTLPPECELLASTWHTPVQAFSYRGLLTGVQFHPEMSGDDLRRLWEVFERDGVVQDVSAEHRNILDATECESLGQLFRNFVARTRVSTFAV